MGKNGESREDRSGDKGGGKERREEEQEGEGLETECAC